MFRITRLTDYGVLLMTQLAKDTAEVHNAAALADQVRVPLPTVSKILQILLHENLLESIRGAGGGYRLARRATDISIRDIIVALEGPIALTECNREAGNCEQESHCTTRDNWHMINQAVRHALGGISLDDMIQPNFSPLIRTEKPGTSTSKLRQAG
ncbi:MAG: SUF system Fe-S cluster assembly regulator [Mariprofundaceae bacterium]|nr:SUF system Fe-S cluster assembly regulator [Mariprofundaceae bacterium]